jgi:hypothetical protein
VLPFQRGQIFWHGTSLSRAHSILVWGFQPQGWYGFGEGRIYFAPPADYLLELCPIKRQL